MTIEVTAKKVEDAIKQGLEQLGASLDEVNVEIVESGGLFRKAKVRLTVEREEPQEQPEKAAEPQKQVAAPKPQSAEPSKPPQQTETPKTEKRPSQKSEKSEKKTEKKPEKKAEQKPEKPTEKVVADDGEHVKNSEDVKKAQARAAEFIAGLVQRMGFTEATVEAAENGDVAISAPSGDDSLIIGRHGETLSAISFLAETMGRAEKQHVNIVADCNGYRERRAASLTAMAKRRADECVRKRRKIKLEPMERVDRRTIHNALTGDDRVATASEGKEPYRYIVIFPKRRDED